mgnify:CR=1 FL=1
MTKVAINGFGRIGRSFFRALYESKNNDIEVVAINDLGDIRQLAHLLKYDTNSGRFPGKISIEDDILKINNTSIHIYQERDPVQLPWKDLEIDVVLESTGVFTDGNKAKVHLDAGAKKVLISAPAKNVDATLVFGVNDKSYDKKKHHIVSNASCTTNCLAPIAKILDQSFGIEEGFITTVHAYTNDQRLADVPHKDLRRSRAAGENIIPTTTGAARAVGKVLPHLKGKLDGLAIRVPVPDGSVVDLVCRLKKPVTRKDINDAVKETASGPMKAIVEYSEEPLVSSDIIGNPHSSIFDALSTQSSQDGYARVLSWYDNEWGYSNRVVDLIDRMASSLD